MASRLSFLGIGGGPASYFVHRYIPAINQILTRHSATFPSIKGESYLVFYYFGGDLSNIEDKLGPARYYAKQHRVTCDMKVSFDTLLSFDHASLQLFFANTIAECFRLMKVRMMKAHQDFDHEEFQTTVDAIREEIISAEISQQESTIETFFRKDVLPIIESVFKDTQKKSGKSFGPKISEIVGE